MKKLIGVTTILVMVLGSGSVAQDLKIGLGGGALFMQGSRFSRHGFYGGGSQTSYGLGGEIEYLLPSLPLTLIGEVMYSPVEGAHRRDSLQTFPGPQHHREGEGSLFTVGLGGRWTPLRGPFSPYLGANLLLSFLDVSSSRFDSSGYVAPPSGYAGPPDGMWHHRESTSFGLGFSVGSEFSLFSKVDLDVGASFNMNNLFAERGSLNTIGFGAKVLYRVL